MEPVDAEPADPDDPEPAPRQLTLGDVQTAVKRLTLPSLDVTVQPGGTTLVNLETIFSTDPEEFSRTVDLLGYSVDVEGTPTSFTWHHGDGTTRTTSRPGRPYPAMDVTHRYAEPARRLTPSVDVTYTVRFRVDGGAWQDLGTTLTAQGPAGVLRVREAGAVLTRD